MELIEFANKFLNHKNKKESPTKSVRSHQEQMLHYISESKNPIVCQGRQMGGTTLLCIYAAYEAIYNDNKQILIHSHKSDSNKVILSTISDFIASEFPEDSYIYGWRGGYIYLKNGSWIQVGGINYQTEYSLEKYDKTLKSSFDICILDNAAFLKEQLLASTFVGLMHKKVVLISSQDHTETFFNKAIKDGTVEGYFVDSFRFNPALMVPWYCDITKGLNDYHKDEKGNYTNDWAKQLITNIGSYERFQSEYACEPFEKKCKCKKKKKNNIINLRLDEDLMNQVGRTIIQTEENVSQYLRRLIEEDIKKREA